jgi:hypothetical protein
VGPWGVHFVAFVPIDADEAICFTDVLHQPYAKSAFVVSHKGAETGADSRLIEDNLLSTGFLDDALLQNSTGEEGDVGWIRVPPLVGILPGP